MCSSSSIFPDDVDMPSFVIDVVKFGFDKPV
jgi:hypothetical protein